MGKISDYKSRLCIKVILAILLVVVAWIALPFLKLKAETVSGTPKVTFTVVVGSKQFTYEYAKNTAAVSSSPSLP